MGQYDKLSIYLSYILRHKPEEAYVNMAKGGWVSVSKLIEGVNKNGFYIDMEILEEIVNTDAKKRYSFNADKTRIRANQGHSINVDMGFESQKPPMILYHGTATKNIDSINAEGIKKMERQFVHLSTGIVQAMTVGERHGDACIYSVKAEEMYDDGYEFYQSENGVWLTDYVPVKYIKLRPNHIIEELFNICTELDSRATSCKFVIKKYGETPAYKLCDIGIELFQKLKEWC